MSFWKCWTVLKYLVEHAKGVAVPHVMMRASALNTLVLCVGLFGSAFGGRDSTVLIFQQYEAIYARL